MAIEIGARLLQLFWLRLGPRKGGRMSDEKSYTEKSTSTTETKTNFFGTPVKDAAGENVKETTTETEGTKEDESGKDD